MLPLGGAGRAQFREQAGLGLRDIWVYLLQPDCALQWPDLEDLRWLSMHGGVRDGQGVEVLISTFGPRKELQWLTGLWPGLRFEMLPAVASREAPDVPYERFRPRFSLTRDLGGPDDTVVLNLDASGRVRSVANQYRGRYPLSAERAP